MEMDKRKYTRKNYWINVVISFLLASMSNIVIGLVLGSEIARLVYLIMLVYWIVIEVRRFQDAGKSGWLALINLIPGIGIFAAVIVAGMLKSNYESEENKDSM